MSSGLDFANLGLNGPQSYRRDNEHMRIYFDGLNVFEHASSNQPQELPPNTANRYRNSDPLTLGRIVKETVERRGEEYLKFSATGPCSTRSVPATSCWKPTPGETSS